MEKEKFVVKVKKELWRNICCFCKTSHGNREKTGSCSKQHRTHQKRTDSFMYRICLNEIRGRGIIYFSASFFVFVNLIRKYFSKLFSDFPIIYALKVNFFQLCPYRNTSEGLHFIKTDQIRSSFCVHLQYRPFSKNRMLNPIS